MELHYVRLSSDYKLTLKRAQNWYNSSTENNKCSMLFAYEVLTLDEKKSIDLEINKLMPIWNINSHLEY